MNIFSVLSQPYDIQLNQIPNSVNKVFVTSILRVRFLSGANISLFKKTIKSNHVPKEFIV